MDYSDSDDSFLGFESTALYSPPPSVDEEAVDVSDVSESESEPGDSGSDIDLSGDDSDGGLESEGEWDTPSNTQDSQLTEASSQFSDFDEEGFWSEELREVEIMGFDEEFGPVHNLTGDATAVDYFHLFIEEEFFELVATETNRYAQQLQDFVGQVDRHWELTTAAEIKAFFGLNILMGVNRLPSYKMYWSTNSFLGNAGFKSVMTARRFEKLVQYLHMVDNTQYIPRGQPGYDRLFKIRPLLDLTKRTFRDQYRPKKDQSIDEGMVKYKGRNSMKQYMPTKPIKRGLKVWMRCDATSGFCHLYQIYLGKSEEQNTTGGIGSKVVKTMCKDLKWKGHHIYMDRYFTSLKLIQILECNGIYACGTVSLRRVGFPQDLVPFRAAARGECQARQHDNIVAII